MSLPWFRMYSEFATDPEVQLLAFEDQRHFIMVLCMKALGVLDKDHRIAEQRERIIAAYLGLDPVAAAEARRRLSEVGLIDQAWQPVNWDKRQFRSDHDAAERKRRQRDRGHGDVTAGGRDRVETCHGLDQNRAEQNRADGTRARDPAPVAPEDPASDAEASTAGSEAAWTAIRAEYPPGTYRANEWPRAEQRLRGLLDDGVTAEILLQAVRDYRLQLEAKGDVGTQFVLPPSKFFADNNWRGPFPIPAPKAGAGYVCSDPKAAQAWERVISSKGACERDGAMQHALEAVGGWSNLQLRTPMNSPWLRSEFCRAYSSFASEAAA